MEFFKRIIRRLMWWRRPEKGKGNKRNPEATAPNKWEGDDLICPNCGNRNGVGRNTVLETIPCEGCGCDIRIPKGYTPDYSAVLNPLFSALDKQNEN